MLNSDFFLHFSVLEDPRTTNHNTRHQFMDIFVLAFIANLCGCDNWSEVEAFCKSKISLFKQFLELPNGIPSHDTFGRVFSLIDSEHLETLLIRWMNTLFNKSKGEIVAIDGKTICGSRKKDEHKGIHLVNAWACENQLTLGTMKVDNKSNEITAILRLLKHLRIVGCTITIDAIGCQKKIVKEILNQGANYVICLKNNQKLLREDVEMSFNLKDKNYYQHFHDSGEETESGHGRQESRRYQCLPIDYFPHLVKDWPGIQSVIKVIRKRQVNENQSEEINYYISSHSYLSNQIPKAIRKHWNIENNLHWQLDISFDEDHCRARVKNEAQNIAILRRISMAYLKRDTTRKGGIKTKRKTAGWDDEFLLSVLANGAQEDSK